MKRHPQRFLDSQRRALVSLRKRVGEQLRAPVKFDRADGRDAGDLSVADEQASFDMRLNEMSYDTLREIDDAILRIDNGTYGVCEETQELIPVERLKVLPFARLTVKCQRDLEMNWSKRSHAVGIKFDDDDAVEEDSGEA